jgi:Golgi nucleoside diphosphatase
VKSLFSKYPFVYGREDVGILDGKFEGIYSWLTLNYALGSYEKGSESRVVSLDLGGGSTQVTFVPSEKVSVNDVEFYQIVYTFFFLLFIESC